MIEDHSPHELVLLLAQPSRALQHNGVRHTAKLCELLKSFLKQRFINFVFANRAEPIACTYGNDTTPLTTKERWVQTYEHLSVRRSGGACKEYLIQRTWAQNLRGDASVMFCEPRRMLNKTAECHFSACRDLMSFPFELGALSLNITHAVFDRAVFSAEDALLRRQHELSLMQVTSSMPLGEGKLLRLLSWYVSTGCCIHDVHNGLKWSIMNVVKDKDLAKNMWKVVASLRSGFSELVAHVSSWVVANIVFKDWEFHNGEKLWTMLGLPSEWVQVLAQLQLRWEDGALCIAVSEQHNDNVISLVVVALMKVWQFREWSDSRWLTIGPCSRTMAGALILGTWLVMFCGSLECRTIILVGFQHSTTTSRPSSSPLQAVPL
jgi:hypothetical protein